MKTLLVLLFMLLPSIAFAADFTWTQAPDVTWGTKIYIGIETGIYTHSEDAGVNTTMTTVDNLLPGQTYYFTATHYDQDGFESGFAPEIIWDSPAGMTFNPLPAVGEIRKYTITIEVNK